MWKVVWSRTTESTGPIRVARKSQPLGFVGFGLPTLCYLSDDLYIYFSMVVMRRVALGSGSGSRSGSGDGGLEVPVALEPVVQIGTEELDARIREILHDEVAASFQAQLPEMFRSIKTVMVEYFDERYAALAETAAAAATSAVTAAGVGGGADMAFQYRDFDNTKPPTFDGTQDAIRALR